MTNKLNLYYLNVQLTGGQDTQFFPTAPLYLNSHLRANHNELEPLIQWKKFQMFALNQDQLVKELEEYDCDILCISCYTWNYNFTLNLIKGIKIKLKKNIHIVLGGPSTEVKNKNFLIENSDFDYAVFAQGEQAFVDIIKHILKIKKLNLLSSRNIAWKDGNKVKISDFHFYKFENISPYLISADIMRMIINDPQYAGVTWYLPYETSKGCMYKCTFCDWTSGYTHRTYFRKFDIAAEIDLIGQLGIRHIHLSDANFGQHRQDVEVAKIMVKLSKEKNYNFKIITTNFSKLLKDRVFEITEILIEGGLLSNGVMFALQDIHQNILDNIDRPDVPWPEHKNYIDKIHKKYPDCKILLNLIMGLPGQTRESWETTLIETYPYYPVVQPFAILPNSPAGYDKDYQDKMQLKTMNLYYYKSDNDNISVNPAAEYVVGSFSFNFIDFCYFHLLSMLCSDVRIEAIHSLIERKELFNLIKKSKNLNLTLEIIAQGLNSNEAIISNHHLNFLEQFIKEYRHTLPKHFTMTAAKLLFDIKSGKNYASWTTFAEVR